MEDRKKETFVGDDKLVRVFFDVLVAFTLF